MIILNRSSPVVGGQYKVRAEHLQRLAYIYIRQSTLKQVEHNRESQVNQYQLVQRAEALGWSRGRIRVIDTDQGLSGQGSEYRSGFKELVAEVSLGHVGIIFGYEVSRLARNNSDWYHLLDLAAVFGTLIADNDGIYDPRLYNDRLLLGLKGTMSEAELHLLRQRLDAGRMGQVLRGEYRQHLPTGLVRQPDGTVVKDPDDQVRHVIEIVLTKFAELGSCPKVLRYLLQENILLPRRQTSGLHKGELLWKPPSDSAIYNIVSNPAYAGAFAYGRKQTNPLKRKPGGQATGRVRKPMEEWIYLQQDVYPAYISWEQYLANRERLRQNSTRLTHWTQQTQGAAREGAALLQGLATCGICGRSMLVSYKNNPRYRCCALAKGFGKATCMSLHAPSVDEVVVQAFFEAIRPAQLDALQAILDSQQTDHQRLSQQWEERLKRARYEAHLCERQYQAVDPENRLVAAELERRWEEKLRQLQETQELYERFQLTSTPSGLTPELREQFQHISEKLPELWPELTNAQKKELLRSLIARVILKRDAPDRVGVKIVWISGHYSVVYAQPPILCQRDVTGYDEMLERIQALLQEGLNDEQIAAQLTEEGFHSARSAKVSPEMVLRIRRKHRWHLIRWKTRNALELDGYLTARGLATRLGVDQRWVYHRISDGTIDPRCVTRHPQADIYLIQNDPELIEQLQQLLPRNHRTEGGI
jgi:DNA invertase Pin-like site-specific DNA recombinase